MEGAANATATATAPRGRRPVVLYPMPGMGHLFAMVELGRTLSARVLPVVVLVVDAPYDTGVPTPRVLTDVSAANPSNSFHRLFTAADFPAVVSNSKHHEVLTMEAVRAYNPLLRAFLAAASPPPAALIVYMFCAAVHDVAEEVGVPAYFFFTYGAATLAFFLHLPVLHARPAASFRDMGEELVSVSGVPPFPATHSIHAVMERDDVAYDGFMEASAALRRSQGVIVNTFRSLEPRVVDAIASGLCAPPGLPTPPVHCIGPLVKWQDQASGRGAECLPWLDKQPRASVVFLCFGGLGRFSAEQTKEVAAGLEASGPRFLWVVRAPPTDDPARKLEKPAEPDLDALLHDGFLRRTKDRGLVVKSWAPQREVLAHGFVTHCGWNSVLEAVTAGVPMLAWPLYAEQRLNMWFLEKDLQLSVALEGCDADWGVVMAGEMAAKVRWLMDSYGAAVLRERMFTVMALAKAALRSGSESETALARLADSWRSA